MSLGKYREMCSLKSNNMNKAKVWDIILRIIIATAAAIAGALGAQSISM